MKIFVTGCSGYIGGTFSYEALKKGHIVYGIDNFVNSTKDKEKITIETNRYAILLKNIKINNKNNSHSSCCFNCFIWFFCWYIC